MNHRVKINVLIELTENRSAINQTKIIKEKMKYVATKAIFADIDWNGLCMN